MTNRVPKPAAPGRPSASPTALRWDRPASHRDVRTVLLFTGSAQAWPCGCTDQARGLGALALSGLSLAAPPPAAWNACSWGLPRDSCAVGSGHAGLRATAGQPGSSQDHAGRARRLDAPATSGARAPRTPLSPSAPRTRELELSRRHKPLGFRDMSDLLTGSRVVDEADSPPSLSHGSASLLSPRPGDCGSRRAGAGSARALPEHVNVGSRLS